MGKLEIAARVSVALIVIGLVSVMFVANEVTGILLIIGLVMFWLVGVLARRTALAKDRTP